MAKRERKTQKTEISYEEQIAKAEQELDALTASVKAKKKQIRLLKKEQIKAEKEKAEKEEQEKKAQIIEAMAKSDKSIEEIVQFLETK